MDGRAPSWTRGTSQPPASARRRRRVGASFCRRRVAGKWQWPCLPRCVQTPRLSAGGAVQTKQPTLLLDVMLFSASSAPSNQLGPHHNNRSWPDGCRSARRPPLRLNLPASPFSSCRSCHALPELPERAHPGSPAALGPGQSPAPRRPSCRPAPWRISDAPGESSNQSSEHRWQIKQASAQPQPRRPRTRTKTPSRGRPPLLSETGKPRRVRRRRSARARSRGPIDPNSRLCSAACHHRPRRCQAHVAAAPWRPAGPSAHGVAH